MHDAPPVLDDRIDGEILRRHPGYCWGKVIVRGLDNRAAPPAVTETLRAAEAQLRAAWGGVDVVAHPAIVAWRAAFAEFGARPSKFQASIESLARRVLRGDALPSINGLVDLYNAASLRHILPVGGDDLDRVTGGTALRLARGDEDYVPLGGTAPDPPEAGEIVYADDATVLCRRWSWRQGERTKISAETRNVVLNIHGLPPVSRAAVEAACRELAEQVPRLLGGKADRYILDAAAPRRRPPGA